MEGPLTNEHNYLVLLWQGESDTHVESPLGCVGITWNNYKQRSRVTVIKYKQTGKH